jgi:hypothetical protein
MKIQNKIHTKKQKKNIVVIRVRTQANRVAVQSLIYRHRFC